MKFVSIKINHKSCNNFCVIFCVIIFNLITLTNCKKRKESECTAVSGLSKTPITGSGLTAKQFVFTFESISEESWKDISSFLNSSGISATYFLSGKDIESNKEKISNLISQGHLIGTTGWSGDDLANASDPAAELRRTDFELSKLVSSGNYFLRSSQPLSTQTIDEIEVSGLGKYIGSIGIDIGQSDQSSANDKNCWSIGTSVDQCLDQYLVEIRKQSRGIINFRSSSNNTYALLRTLVSQLKSEGYVSIKLDQIPDIQAKVSKQKAFSSGKQCNDYK